MKPAFALRHFFLTLFIIVAHVTFAQNDYYKVYGTFHEDFLYRLDHCSDNGYYMLGTTNTSPLRDDAFLIRADSSGNIIWEKIIQFDTSGVHLTGGGMLDDESYILLFKEYNPMYQPMTIMMRLDTAGDTLWTKTIFGMDVCCFIPNPITPLSNGEFLLGGRYQLFMGDAYYGCIQKIDAFGNSIFKSTYTPDGTEVFLNNYILTPDSEVVAVGYLMEHIGTHPIYSFFVRIDMNGNITSNEIYRDSGDVNFNDVVNNPDHTFTIATAEKLFLKVDTGGTILSAIKNIGTDGIFGIQSGPDSSYLIRAGVHGYGQLTATFDTMWTVTFPSEQLSGSYFYDHIRKSLTVTANTDTLTNVIGNKDGVLINIDSTGQHACVGIGHADIQFQPVVNSIIGFDTIYYGGSSGSYINANSYHQIILLTGISSDTVCSPLNVDAPTKNSLLLFPNPISGSSFQLLNLTDRNATYLLIGMDGKIISELKHNADFNFSLPSGLSNGIYFLRIQSKDEITVLKLVLAK